METSTDRANRRRDAAVGFLRVPGGLSILLRKLSGRRLGELDIVRPRWEMF